MQRLAPLLLIALAPLLLGFSSKPKFTVSFHAQADDMDPKKTMFPFKLEGRDLLFKLVPEVSQENMVAFHPFDSETGNGKGVALQLDFRGQGALEILSRSRRGQFLLAMVNGVPTDYVVIDQVITDGIVTVWQGVPETVLQAMEKKYPHIQAGGAPTINENMEMAPSTKKEKKRAYADAKAAERAAKKKPDPNAKERVTELGAPSAPVSNKMPVEGAAPTTGTPLPSQPQSPQDLPLPKR